MNQAALLNHNEGFSPSDLEKLDLDKIPKHIAIIMDGNRRWASSHNLPIAMGYIAGAEALTKIVRASSKLGIKVITAYSFSTENWSRSEEEIETLMEIFETYLIKQRLPMKADGVRFNTIGDLSRLPQKLQEEIQSTKEFTSDCDTIDLVLAMNYGGRDEICRAMKKIARDLEEKKIQQADISEEVISHYLDTSSFRDPDLLIRTSGEMRISNFLIWQICYAEVYVTRTYWPDFSAQSLLKAIVDYQNRIRRHGGT